ncbi:MAG: RNA polymerase sigma factor FliA [Deltaproteobacteria bacterium]|nr:RNA polymerase sigma factor FliA [Deltaproteobacteria bacterium]HCH61617.1 RNA polymerase sigma factor FliA [Deltaproteobacteria bacterium]
MVARALPLAERNAVLTTNIKLVRTIARRLAHRLPPSVEVDELVSIGMLGLMDAWERFDTARGVTFKSYAELRIKGQMIDSLRRNDWVPRSARKKCENLEATSQIMARRLGRTPTMEELRVELDMSKRAFDAYCADAQIRPLTSLDAPLGEEGSARIVDRVAHDEASVADMLVRNELRSEVARAVENLPAKERIAVTMSYLENLTLKEIGKRLGVTESRACQLRSQGVKRLRFRLRDVS